MTEIKHWERGHSGLGVETLKRDRNRWVEQSHATELRQEAAQTRQTPNARYADAGPFTLQIHFNHRFGSLIQTQLLLPL